MAHDSCYISSDYMFTSFKIKSDEYLNFNISEFKKKLFTVTHS